MRTSLTAAGVWNLRWRRAPATRQSGGPVQLVVVAAGQASIRDEVVADSGMDGGERPQASRAPEALHPPFPPQPEPLPSGGDERATRARRSALMPRPAPAPAKRTGGRATRSQHQVPLTGDQESGPACVSAGLARSHASVEQARRQPRASSRRRIPFSGRSLIRWMGCGGTELASSNLTSLRSVTGPTIISTMAKPAPIQIREPATKGIKAHR